MASGFVKMPDMDSAARIALFAALAIGGAGCAVGDAHVEIRGHRFSVEIADDNDERLLGLMFRDAMAQDHGMLFIFPDEAPRAFWMKNTRIPLDIIYFNRELRLVSVAENARPCRTQRCPGYPSAGPAMYVLELNAGKAAEMGLTEGDTLVLHLDR